MFNKNIFRYKKQNNNLSEYSSTRGLTGCGVCKREKEREEGRKEEKSCLGGEKKSSIETVEVIVRWRTEERALGREMERGSWRYLTFNNLPNSLEYATTSPTRRI